jgi:hypothetical protein
VHGVEKYYAGSQWVEAVEGVMSRPKAHYSMVIKNHVSGARLKVELIDLPFTEQRQFRVRVNGPSLRRCYGAASRWARKMPVASKTIVTRQVRGWLVRH